MARRFFVWAAILSLFVDQVLKLLVYGSLMGPDPSRWRVMTLIPSILVIHPTRNPDGLFGWAYGPPWIYFVLPSIGILLVLWFALRSRDRWASFAYGVILGGAAGNLIDRARLGWVIDFIDFRLPVFNFRWFTFNPADALIVVGIILLLALELFGKKSKAEEPVEKPGPAETEETNDEQAAGLPG